MQYNNKLSMMGDKNPMWKGDDVSYKSLHNYIRNHLAKSSFCEYCENIPYDVANISGEYNKNLTNWKWLCRRCHMKSDGRMEKLIIRMKTAHPCLGRKHSDETKYKMRVARAKQVFSDASREKMSKSRIKYWQRIHNQSIIYSRIT